MRRQQPVLLGVLKTDEKDQTAWIKTIWRLQSGGLRVVAQKGTVVGKNAKTGEMLTQMKLVDVNGNPIKD